MRAHPENLKKVVWKDMTQSCAHIPKKKKGKKSMACVFSYWAAALAMVLVFLRSTKMNPITAAKTVAPRMYIILVLYALIACCSFS